MIVAETIAAAREAVQIMGPRRALGVVPTMGALHAGHLSLVRAARRECTHVAATIFVNPTQFAPGEDFSRYPRTFEADRALLEAEGVDLLFAPDAPEMYPPGATTFVEVDAIGDRLDGASRPGHFRGVATVVAKLFHILEPERAYFGQKDAAQVAVLRKMVRDLNFPLKMIVCPTVREPDGLAMSCRNRYLSPPERAHAVVLYRALLAAGAASDPLAAAGAVLAEVSAVRLDYLALVDPDTLEPVADLSRGGLLAVAAWIGATRLIDNVLIPPRP